MEFSKTNVKDHQFLEVDEDLRRIGEMESSNPMCPFGKNCYRKNPSHLRDYRHHSGSPKPSLTNDKSDPKRGKITNYFNQKPSIGVKKLSIESSIDPNADQKDNNSKNKVVTDSASIKDKANTSVSVEPSPKRIKYEAGNSSNQNNKNKTNDIWVTSDFDDICKSNDNNLKPKQMNPFYKKNSSPKALTLKPTEDKSDNKDLKQIKPFETTNQTHNEPKEEKTINDLMKSKLASNELNQLIKDIFLFEMPKDFFFFWQFCKSINRENPEDALVETLGLRLVGPYDILTGKVKKSQIKDTEQILCHWRYFYDLPEFQTIIASVKTGYHLGYFRDTPDEDNPVVVANNSDKCVIEGVADNICAAIYTEIQKLKSKDSSNSSLKQLETKLKTFCSQNKIDLNSNSKLKSRKSKINAKTFNGFGFVVPYDKKTEVGYRPLPETDSNLKRLLNTILKVDPEVRSECKSLMELQEIIQLITYANDECDFGMGLELGIDLFCFGDQFFHKSSLHLLTMAYNLLKRDPFSRIITAHLQNRRKGFKLDSI